MHLGMSLFNLLPDLGPDSHPLLLDGVGYCMYLPGFAPLLDTSAPSAACFCTFTDPVIFDQPHCLSSGVYHSGQPLSYLQMAMVPTDLCYWW